MKILGNRILVSRIEEERQEGFQTVNVQDSFVNKGKVEDVGNLPIYKRGLDSTYTEQFTETQIKPGDIVLFAKYSPDTQEVKHEGKDIKIINVEDILAIL